MHTRLISFVRAAATVAVVAGTMFASAASAQVCPYNSTQGTCACPTSGAGTTCFGGQLFRSSDNSCQNDVRPCAANQNWNCSTTSCVCNTASYPCGGCTAATSTVGGTCSAPIGGRYTSICGACACPSGTTLCSSSNTCVTTLSCPAGTTFNPCTNSCDTPNVLLSPAWIQSGFIQVNGDVKSTAGNIRLDQATAGGQGDIYVANGKAIRVDGAGVTNINIGNWGAGGTGVDVNFPATSRICFGATCRNSWPSTTDFNPTYINANGDTMTGDLNLTGASTDLFVAGKLGIGTTTPQGHLDVRGQVPYNVTDSLIEGGSSTTYNATATVRGKMLDLSQVDTVTSGIVTFDQPMAQFYRYFTESGGTVNTTGPLVQMSDVSNHASTSNVLELFQGNFSGTGSSLKIDHYGVGPTVVVNDENADVTPFTIDQYGRVGIGTTAPTGRFSIYRDSASNIVDMYYGTGANQNWALGMSNVTNNDFTLRRITTQPTVGSALMTWTDTGRVGVGVGSPTELFEVFGRAKVSNLTITTGAGAGRYLVSDASGNAAWSTTAPIGGSGTANYLPKFNAASTVGNSQLFDNGTSVGVNTSTPTARMQVGSDTYDFPGAQQRRFTTSLTGAQLFMNDSSGVSIMAIGTGPGSDDHLGFNLNGSVPLLIQSNGSVGVGTTTPTAKLDVAGETVITSQAGTALTVTKSGTSNAHGISVTTAAAGNAIAAIRAENTGTGRGLEVTGGTNSVAAHIKGKGNNYALDASMYDHSSTNTMEMVMQVRRGTSGASAVGMGGSIDFPLEGSGGSFYGGTRIGSVIASISPWKTDFVVHPSSYSGGEEMRLTADGVLSVGGQYVQADGLSNRLAYIGDDGSGNDIELGSRATTVTNIGFWNAADSRRMHLYTGNLNLLNDGSEGAAVRSINFNGQTGNQIIYNTAGVAAPSFSSRSNGTKIVLYPAVTASSVDYAIGIEGSTQWYSVPGTASSYSHKFYGGTTELMRIRGDGNVGIAATAPAVDLAVGGNGVDVYATNAWIENNMHVQGNEALAAGGRGRMRVGTAWGYMGLYTDATSTGAGNDLVLGASSGTVRVGPEGVGQNLDVNGAIGANGLAPSSGYGIRAYGTTAGAYFDSDDYDIDTWISYSDRYSVYGYGWLRAEADNYAGIYIGGDSAGSDIEIGSTNSSVNRLALWNSAGSTRMDVYGGNYYNVSSIRFKENVAPIEGALETLTRLQGVYFDWKADSPSGDRGKRDVGLIAEEVQKVFPIAVQLNDDGLVENLSYTKLIPLLIQAVNEQQDEIDGLKSRLEALEKRFAE